MTGPRSLAVTYRDGGRDAREDLAARVVRQAGSVPRPGPVAQQLAHGRRATWRMLRRVGLGASQEAVPRLRFPGRRALRVLWTVAAPRVCRFRRRLERAAREMAESLDGLADRIDDVKAQMRSEIVGNLALLAACTALAPETGGISMAVGGGKVAHDVIRLSEKLGKGIAASAVRRRWCRTRPSCPRCVRTCSGISFPAGPVRHRPRAHRSTWRPVRCPWSTPTRSCPGRFRRSSRAPTSLPVGQACVSGPRGSRRRTSKSDFDYEAVTSRR